MKCTTSRFLGLVFAGLIGTVGLQLPASAENNCLQSLKPAPASAESQQKGSLAGSDDSCDLIHYSGFEAGGGGDAVIQLIENAIESVLPAPGTPITSRNLLQEVQAAHAAILGLEGVATSIIIEPLLTVNTLLDDGSLHFFIHNRLPGADEAAGQQPQAIGLSSSRASAIPRALEIPGIQVAGPPGSARAVVASYDGGVEVASKVRSLLSGAGYSVLPLGASVEDMRQYSNLGALYIDTHSMVGVRLRDNGDGTYDKSEKIFALQTSTTVTGTPSEYLNELLSGTLVYSVAVEADGSVKTKLGITERFIANHWSFDEGVVMIHACYGGAAPFTVNSLDLNPLGMRLAILGAGADVFASFDNLTWASYAEPSILYFWDHLLGANVHDPSDPPSRPFDVPSVKSGMSSEGLLTFVRPRMDFLGIGIGGNDVNVTFDGGTEKTTLAPSIRLIDMVDDVAQGTGEMTLSGLFGANQGSVEIEQIPVTVTSWSEETIVAQVPFKAGGSAGPVQVKTPDNIKSNKVPLTEWRGTLIAKTEGEGTQKAEANVKFIFRADVHKYRDALTSDPLGRKQVIYLNPSSEGSSIGTGSYTDPEDGSVTSYSGSYPLRILTQAEVDGGGVPPTSGSTLGARIELDADAGTARICVSVNGDVDITADGGSLFVKQNIIFGSLPILAEGGDSFGLLGCATVSMDSDSYQIDGFKETHTEDAITFSIEWGELIPFSPPDDDTKG